jgi:hypothetical protein
MIKRESPEWHTFIKKLVSIKSKSNREVFCVKCWQMFNCKQRKKHIEEQPDHAYSLLTSTQFASDEKICELANAFNKFITKPNGEEFMYSPYTPPSIIFRDKVGGEFNCNKKLLLAE